MTDSYHQALARYGTHPWHRGYLLKAYAAGHALLCRTGRDPLGSSKAPHVLLCGTGSADTTAAFWHFLRERCPGARLAVVDLGAAPLHASRARLGPEAASFAVANALKLPFADETFELIETDFFLQYFDHEAKRSLLTEWRRVLKPNGALMTRDWVPASPSWGLEAVLDKARQTILRRSLGRELHQTSRLELSRLLEDCGFVATLEAVRPRFSPVPLPLVQQLVARPVQR